MMTCDFDRAALEAYLDGESTPEQATALQQHLRACPECAAEVAAMVSLRRQTRAAGSRFKPAAEFRRKVQAQAAPRRRGFPMMRFAAAAVLSLAALMVAIVWARQDALQADTFREVADLHVADLASANPYDVVSSDRHTVKPWFQGRIPFAFNLPEFAGTEFSLFGGRIVSLHQQPAAQVIVGVGRHKISILVAQEPVLQTAFPLSHGVVVRNSFNVETWANHGLRFFVIGDAEKTEVQKLAQTLRDANQ
jgi:anti-sigma factor RsiW